MINVQDWPSKSDQLLNNKNIVCNKAISRDEVRSIKQLSNIVKFNLQNFTVWPVLTAGATRSFLCSGFFFFFHIENNLTSWSFTGVTTLKLIESLYTKGIKVFWGEQNPSLFNCCVIEHTICLLHL